MAELCNVLRESAGVLREIAEINEQIVAAIECGKITEEQFWTIQSSFEPGSELPTDVPELFHRLSRAILKRREIRESAHALISQHIN